MIFVNDQTTIAQLPQVSAYLLSIKGKSSDVTYKQMMV